jgi:hypothetical protein
MGRIATVAGLGTFASILSPVGLLTYRYLIAWQGSTLEARTVEWTSPFGIWRDSGATYPAYWVFLALALAALFGLARQRRFSGMAVTLALAALSLTSLRFAPFLALVSTPYVARGLTAAPWIDRAPRSAVRALLVAGVVVLGAIGLEHHTLFRTGLQPGRFPAAPVASLAARRATGIVFTHFNWGGYLIWELGGRLRPTIDGRVLDESALVPYTHILWWTPEGQRFFEAGRFDYVLVPGHNPVTGEVYPLPGQLQHDRGWRLAANDDDAWLFERAVVPMR